MPTYGKIEEYHARGDWTQYIERLNHYFAANDITNNGKKRDILLSVCGQKTYKLLRDLFAPNLPGTKSYDELVTKLKDHQDPKPSEILQRFKFNMRVKKDGESVREFVADLRSLSEHCNFGETLEAMIRDRLVVGIKDDRIQRRLLAEPELDFKKALETATGMETAAKNAKEIQSKENGTATNANTVNKMLQRNPLRVNQRGTTGECYRCGGQHNPRECMYIKEKCYICQKKGHLAKKCRNAAYCQHHGEKVGVTAKSSKEGHGQSKNFYKSRGKARANYLQDDDEDDLEDAEMYTIQSIRGQRIDPYTTLMLINGKSVRMEIDTGASVSVISEFVYNSVKKNSTLESTRIRLKSYTGEEIQTLGQAVVSVGYKGKEFTLPIIVVEGRGACLIGRDWLSCIKLDWKEIVNVRVLKADAGLQNILDKYQNVFKDELGTLKGTKAKIYVTDNATPKFFKPRPVPYALKEKIERELERLEKEGTIEQVQFSEWAAPIVPIVKDDKSIRICGDYKVTTNQVSKLDNYPIPKTDDLYAELGGGKQFTKLDLSHAYQQLLMDDDSKKYTTINTHKGLFQYNRLPYGISSAPGIFQRTMENVLQGIPMVVVRIDDILLTGKTTTEHLSNLEQVLKRLDDSGMRVKRKKCYFMENEVIYLGHRIDEKGVYPVAEKVDAIQNAPEPKNVTELKSYLGLLNYYHRFLPNIATQLEPLHRLLQKGACWNWGNEQRRAFDKSKSMLSSSNVLVHFDANKELLLSCDASPYGIGAVLSHKMEDGTDRPIGFMSRTLTSAERNYSQLEKGALAIIFGLKKYHQYLFGHSFTILTDHKPLIGLFNENKATPAMAAARIQRWSLTLAAYENKIVYKQGQAHGNADGLSRLPIQQHEEIISTNDAVLILETMENPINVTRIKDWTRRDVVLSQVVRFVLQGWPATCPKEDYRPYFARKSELTVHDGCLLWGSRVVVPQRGREAVLGELHECHPGNSKMKALARSYVWWPKLDSDIENQVKICHICQKNRHAPPEAPLHPWDFPKRSWVRLHLDFAGPFMDNMFLILIDAHSKWMEVKMMKTITTEATIEQLRAIFATHGLPEMIVTDNGSSFTSIEFEHFMKMNGIQHRLIAPYHPSSNGLAERAVQTFKEGMRKLKSGSIQTRLSRLLFTYRITPQTTTGISPAELLMNRKPRSLLDLLRPDISVSVNEKQAKQKKYHDHGTKQREFSVGEKVFARNYARGERWIPGIIITKTGPLSYVIETSDGRSMRKHVDQLRKRQTSDELDGDGLSDFDFPEMVGTPKSVSSAPTPGSVDTGVAVGESVGKSVGKSVESVPPAEPRYPARERKRPEYLKDYQC